MDTVSHGGVEHFCRGSKAGLEEFQQGRIYRFAPTNDAFAALPEGKLERLLQPRTSNLKRDTTYHVIPRRLSVEDFRAGENINFERPFNHVFFEKPPMC